MHLPHEQVVDESLRISQTRIPTFTTPTPTQEDKQERKIGIGSDDENGKRSTKDTTIPKGRSICMVGSSQKDPSFRSSSTCSNNPKSDNSGKPYQEREGLKPAEGSHIYGGARAGGISFIGSWALGSCSDLAGAELGMSSKSRPEGQTGRGDEEGTLSSVSSGLIGNGGVGGHVPSLRIETGARLQVRMNDLVKSFIVLVLIVFLGSVFFHAKIRGLQEERRDLRKEVAFLSSRVNILVRRMEDVVALIPPKRSYRPDSGEQDEEWEDEPDKAETGSSQGRAKRSPDAVPGPRRSTKNLQYSLNSLNNGTSSFDSMLDPSWSTRVTPSAPAPSKGPRAAYLLIDGNSVHIKKSRQLIGPWYLSDSGEDIGFGGSDVWYDNLALSSNRTSVVFQEDGLFLIYAQVFYQLQQVHNANPVNMGYRIHLKRGGLPQGGRKPFRNPIVIAECVPSFPTTIYQTCYTQVVWSVQAQDEIYLEHFTESHPIIEARNNGQTFLGIVRLSN